MAGAVSGRPARIALREAYAWFLSVVAADSGREIVGRHDGPADPLRFPDLSLSVVKLLGPGEYVRQRPGQPDQRHFCLAVDDYAHTTAPNQRYADLVPQRLLKATSTGAPSPYRDDELVAIAAHCTERENAAPLLSNPLIQQPTLPLAVASHGQQLSGALRLFVQSFGADVASAPQIGIRLTLRFDGGGLHLTGPDGADQSAVDLDGHAALFIPVVLTAMDSRRMPSRPRPSRRDRAPRAAGRVRRRSRGRPSRGRCPTRWDRAAGSRGRRSIPASG